MFQVDKGKLHDYIIEYNNIAIFSNQDMLKQFEYYSTQDSVALLNCLINAQKIYIEKYNIDIGSIWSTSTLSMKIFRMHFLELNINCLTRIVDSFIRDAYYGGATDYYYKYGENLHHYDVNSLYPFAMLKPMPTRLKVFHPNLEGFNLSDLFGYFLVNIECPKDMKYPFVPYRDPQINSGGVTYPTGKWTGTYFSELLKVAVKHGYKVTLIKGYTFYEEVLFKHYVEHFYDSKRNTTGPNRWIAKMHLNQVYGYFGRSLDSIETKNVNNNELIELFGTRVVKHVIKINDDRHVALIQNNFNEIFIKQLNIKLDLNLKDFKKNVKANVALAAAATSYAQVIMAEYKVLCAKLGIKVLYSETDSLITDKPLPNYLIGRNIGLMKDDLEDGIIIKGYLFGIKKYGYVYKDKEGNLHTKSVFSGVSRDSINLNELEEINKGTKITK